MIIWPRTAYCTTAAQAARSAARSGVSLVSTGVRTQMMTVSAAAAAAGSLVSSERLVRQGRGEAVLVGFGQVRVAGETSRSRSSLTSMPIIRGLLPCNSTAVGSSTYPRPTMATEPVVTGSAETAMAISMTVGLPMTWRFEWISLLRS